MHLNQERINLFHQIYEKLHDKNIQSISLCIVEGQVGVTYSIKGDFGPVDSTFHMKLNKYNMRLDMDEAHALLAVCDYPRTSNEMFHLYNFSNSSMFIPYLKLHWTDIEETVKTYPIQAMRNIQYDDFLVEGEKTHTHLMTQGRYAYLKGDFFYILTYVDNYHMLKETNMKDYIIPISFVEEGKPFNGGHFALQKTNVNLEDVQKINRRYTEAHNMLNAQIARLKEKEKPVMDRLLFAST